MSTPLSRAVLIHSPVHKNTPLALAACIAATIAGIADAQAQQPRSNVRVILSPGDVIPGQRFPLNTDTFISARINDDGVISAFLGQARTLVVASAQNLTLFDPDPAQIPPDAGIFPFTTNALVSGRPGHLVIRAQSGDAIGTTRLRDIIGMGIAGEQGVIPGTDQPTVFFEVEIKPSAVVSGNPLSFLEDPLAALWTEQSGEFTCVARGGDPVAGPGAPGGILHSIDLFGGTLGTRATTFVADIDYPDTRRPPEHRQLLYSSGGQTSRLFATGEPRLPGCNDARATYSYVGIMEGSGDALTSVDFTCPPDSCCPSGPYTAALLRARPGSYELLLDYSATFADGRRASRAVWIDPLAELANDTLILDAAFDFNDGRYSLGLWFLRDHQLRPIRTTSDALPFPPTVQGFSTQLLGIADDDSVYYLFEGSTPPSLPDGLIGRWKNGTTTDLFYSGYGAPGIASSCRIDVVGVGIDPRGGVIVSLFPWSCRNTSQALGGALYRIADDGTTTPLLIPNDLITLADGSTATIAHVQATTQCGAATNRYGQMLAVAYLVEQNEPVVVLLETTALCRADYNADGVLNPDDIGDFITSHFAPLPSARTDFDDDGTPTTDDLGDYLSAYFAGCP